MHASTSSSSSSSACEHSFQAAGFDGAVCCTPGRASTAAGYACSHAAAEQ
jgi:hypothetical protein